MSRINTKCVHAGKYIDRNSLGLNTPIYASTAHIFHNEIEEIRYPRWSNTLTHIAVAEKIAALENAEAALILSSGMAAESTVFFSLLKKGDHALFQAGLYGGTQQLIAELPRYGIEVSVVNTTEAEVFAQNLRENTRLLFLETPTNPLLRVTNLEKLADYCKTRNILTAVDNTFATPVNQNPLNLGIDIVTHSGTKYLNGHSDLLCGAIASSREMIERFTGTAITHGGTVNPQTASLLERGLKTLGIRVEVQNRNALAIADYLEKHPKIARIHYPGLESHPDHKIARRQMRGFGGMLSFEIDCDRETAYKFAKSLKIITPAVSLGGVESILCFPADTSHIRVPPVERQAQGITDTLIRLSVGIEDVDDLLDDLDKSLKAL